MAKYIAFFRVPVATMDEWRKSTSPEEIQKQSGQLMQDMNAWMEKHKAMIVDKGTPLGKTKTVTGKGIADSRNDLNYMMVVEAPSHDEAAHIFADCPHVAMIPDSTIDVMEVPHMGL